MRASTARHADPKHAGSTLYAMGSPAKVLQHILGVVVPVQERHFRNALAE